MKSINVFYLDEKKEQIQPELERLVKVLKVKGYAFHRILQVEDIEDNGLPIITIGGDGTILKASQVALSCNIPVLGISSGNLGFLAEVKIYDFEKMFQLYLEGKYFIDKRDFLELSLDNKQQYALNEVTFRHLHAGMVELDMYLNDVYLTTYKADGLIIASSTGSTAYNLSAGGPIIFPDTQVMIVTPICPHSLTVRPLVLSSKDKLRIESHSKKVFAVVDGREEQSVSHGANVSFSDKQIQFIRFSKHSFIDGLRSKLNWSGRLPVLNAETT